MASGDVRGFNRPAIAAALTLAFHPFFALAWVIHSWEDKWAFFLIPYLTVYLLTMKQLRLFSMVIGVAAGLNGLTLMFLPAFCMWAWQGKRPLLLYALIGLSFSICPYFPDSLGGWQNRMMRMNSPAPFWFSIWQLSPVYHPIMDKLLLIGVSLISAWLLATGRITLTTALVLCIGVVVAGGVYNTPARIAPYAVFVLAIADSRLQHWLVMAALLSACIPLLYLPADQVTPLAVVVCFAPPVWAGFIYTQGTV